MRIFACWEKFIAFPFPNKLPQSWPTCHSKSRLRGPSVFPEVASKWNPAPPACGLLLLAAAPDTLGPNGIESSIANSWPLAVDTSGAPMANSWLIAVDTSGLVRSIVKPGCATSSALESEELSPMVKPWLGAFWVLSNSKPVVHSPNFAKSAWSSSSKSKPTTAITSTRHYFYAAVLLRQYAPCDDYHYGFRFCESPLCRNLCHTHIYIYIYIIGPTVADKSSGYAGITAFYD